MTNDQRLQSDVAARIQADAILARIGCVREMDGLTESDAALALGPGRAGGVAGAQAGSLIIVRQTSDGSDTQPNVPGPRESFRLVVSVLELPKLARTQPDYLSFFVIAARIKALCHQCQIGTAPVLYARGTPTNDGQGTVGKDLTFTWTPAPQFSQAVAMPQFQDVVGIAWGFPSRTPGAVCYATTDGSYPVPTGDPVAEVPNNSLPAGTLLRVVAYADGMIPSGVAEKQF